MKAAPPKTGGPRNHHFVPQYYLKGFAKPRSKIGKLFVCDLSERRRFRTKPRNVAARRDYNRVDIEGVDPNIVESQLSEVEGKADQALRRIFVAQSIANEEDFAMVLILIALLFLNNPTFRKQRDDIISNVAKQMMGNMLATPERWASVASQAEAGGVNLNDSVSYEEVREAVATGRIVPHTMNHALIAQEMQLWPDIVPLLRARKWQLLISDAVTGEFATADKPCVLRWTDPALNKGPYGVGLGSPDSTITFPLSSHLALFGTFEGENLTLPASPEIVATFNFQTMMGAIRQVYSGSDFPVWDVGGRIRPFSESLTQNSMGHNNTLRGGG